MYLLGKYLEKYW